MRASIGITWSKERHTIYSILTSTLCRCGCNGHCTIDALQRVVNESINHCQRGMEPLLRMLGEPWILPRDRARARRAGKTLPFRKCVLTEYRADWPERASASGQKNHSGNLPCMSCDVKASDMHTGYSLCSVSSLPWKVRTREAYFTELNERLIKVSVGNDETRDFIAANLVWLQSWPWGRVIRTHTPQSMLDIGLRAGDKLITSNSCFNPHDFDSVARIV